MSVMVVICVCVFHPTALAGNACLVCGSLPSQREEWGHHVCAVRHGDPERNWNQQSSASLKAPISNSGDGFPNESFSSSDIPNCESVCAPTLSPGWANNGISESTEQNGGGVHFHVSVNYAEEI